MVEPDDDGRHVVTAVLPVPAQSNTTELGYKVDPKLRELATHGHREPGGGVGSRNLGPTL